MRVWRRIKENETASLYNNKDLTLLKGYYVSVTR